MRAILAGGGFRAQNAETRLRRGAHSPVNQRAFTGHRLYASACILERTDRGAPRYLYNLALTSGRRVAVY